MRTAILAVICLAVGGAIGSTLARQEFAHEVLPLETAHAGGGLAEAGGPRLTILSQEKFNFGFMDQNSKMSHVFEIQNDGDQPLTVRLEGTSCKCTAAGLNRDQLPPGEKAQVTLEWEGKGQEDVFEQYAEYSTNDLSRPKFRLTVAGTIRKTLQAIPSEAVFNRVSSQEPAQATLKILSMGKEPLEIISHKFTHAKSAPFFSIESKPLDATAISPTSEYQSGVELQVHLKPGLPQGQLTQSLQISTSRNPAETFEIPIYGSIVSDISLIGPRASAETMTVDLGSFQSKQGAKSTVYLIVKGPHREQTELKVASVDPAAEMSATFGEPIRTNPQIVSYPLTFEVKPGATPVSRISPGSRIVVDIATTHPEVRELTLFIKYAVVD